MLNYGQQLKSDNDKFTFTLTCLRVGSHSLKITLGNAAAATAAAANENPFVESVTITDVECAHPADFDLNSLPIVGAYENISANRRCVNTHLIFNVDFVVELVHRVKNAPICSFPKLTSTTAQAHLLRFMNKSASGKFSIKSIENEGNYQGLLFLLISTFQ